MSFDAFTAVVGKLFGVMLLVFLNGFFVAAEFAIVRVRGTQLEGPLARGHRRAKIARTLLRNLDAALSATQLGITLTSLGLGWIGEPVFAALLQPVMGWLRIESPELQHTLSFAIGFSLITFLHIVLGELAPKSLAIQKPLPTTLWIAYPMLWFHKISFPAIWALNHTSNWLLRRVGIEPASEGELTHSEEELRLLFTESRSRTGRGGLSHDLVLNALDLRRRIAREVMRPRQEIVGFDTNATIAECIDLAEKTRFSRFPLFENGSPDHTRGVIHIKDLYASRHTAARAADLIPLARQIVFVPETARLERVLGIMLDRHVHFAIVVDEFGGTVGLITLENILEEVVGQIQDEFDQEKPLLMKTGENTWSIDGALPLHDLSDVLGELVAEEGITTASGWVTHKLGGFPTQGDRVKIGRFELRVEQMDGPRVARLTLTQKPDAAEHPKG